jgi:hypothetical protein
LVPSPWFFPEQFAPLSIRAFLDTAHLARIPRGLLGAFSLAKLFPLSELRAFEFRAEFFNLFNHPNFANPISNLNALVATGGRIDTTTGQVLNAGNFGHIISTSNNPRIIQLALKFTF